MKGQELKILFRQDKAFLTADRPLTFIQLGLPDFVKYFKVSAYWTVRVLSYKEDENRIICEITSYQVGETEFDSNQKLLAEKLNGLEFITFKSIDTTELLRNLSGVGSLGARKRFAPVERTPIQPVDFVRKPFTVVIAETFKLPLKNVHFVNGGVLFEKRFREHTKPIRITIPNYDIREEFDAVKNYFANALNAKMSLVRVNILIIDDEVTSIEAHSAEIQKIDKQLIENVKLMFVASSIKMKSKVELEKSLFTMDEYFGAFTDGKLQSNTFYKDDKQFFEDLLTVSNSKHYRHLRFLSSRHLHQIMKLRFVHKPFSFIFLIQGDTNYHFVWETLDTKEATYVWHMNKDINVLKMNLKKIEDVINLFKVDGKTAYIGSTNDQFTRVYHDYADHVDGFVKWKGDLESLLS